MEEGKNKTKLQTVCLCSCVFAEVCVGDGKKFSEHERVCLYFLSTQSALSLVPLRSLLQAKNLEVIALIHVVHKPVKAPVA